MSVKKKQLLTATLLIALTAAVAVNWYYTNNPPVASPDGITEISDENFGNSLLVAGTVSDEYGLSDNESVETASITDSNTYFSQAKLKRSQSHDEIIEEIEDLLDDDSLSAEEKATVTLMLNDFKDAVKKETDIENLINAKTSGQCIVVINDGMGSVVVEKGALNDTLVMQITDIFEKNTGISAENLTIIEAK